MSTLLLPPDESGSDTPPTIVNEFENGIVEVATAERNPLDNYVAAHAIGDSS